MTLEVPLPTAFWLMFLLPSLPVLAILLHVVSYLRDTLRLRRFPGPPLARLSDVWLAWHCGRGTINRAVLAAHCTYGPVVRIAPNHVSIADVSALHLVYGHGSGALKADFYDAFVGRATSSVFTTRSRHDHTRKRKALAHTFSPKSVLEFEPIIREYLGAVIKKWDQMCTAASQGKGGVVGEMTWASEGGRAVFDAVKWYNFMVFDIIGHLVFRHPFGMTERATEMTLVVKQGRDDAMQLQDKPGRELEYTSIPAVQSINTRSTFLATMGMLPKSWRPLLRKLPLSWFNGGHLASEFMLNLAMTAVSHRSQHQTTFDDILGKYLGATDDRGQKMNDEELIAEALTLLIGGTDTTSSTVAALTFYLARNPPVQAKLQKELDEAFGKPSAAAADDDDDGQPNLVKYERIKNLSYLQDVVNEGLRLFSTIGLGLPRVVPDGGLTVLGHTLAPGTVVSVPTYIIHHDEEIWGDDAWSFNPDRWQTRDKAKMSKAFAPFSLGPRACIGRNLAFMELLLVVANIFHRFEASSPYPGREVISLKNSKTRWSSMRMTGACPRRASEQAAFYSHSTSAAKRGLTISVVCFVKFLYGVVTSE